jgi:predicted PurR-regulated permease PerM
VPHALLLAAAFAIVVAGLWAAKPLLVPLVLATLLSFLLAPLADRLERWRLPRIAAVLLVTALAFAAIAALAYVVVGQALDLVESLPRYRRNIEARVQEVDQRTQALMSRFSEMTQHLRARRQSPGSGQSNGSAASTASPIVTPPLLPATQPAPPPGTPEQPLHVRVEPAPLDPIDLLRDYAGAILGPLTATAIVIIFVIFMLLQRDDLRDRIIRLIGQRRIYLTSHALGDAGHRISRYLLMQLIINLTYGLPVAAGLWFLGLPSALLWGLLATLLRFIPYLGPWLAASMPIILSLAVFQGWLNPLLVVGLFIGLELFSNNVMEPWLYGTTTGLSPVAVLLAATFWSWLWGPVGLLLAVPITACLVVAGHYIPPLHFLAVLLGDKLVLDPHVRLYQQLAEMDAGAPLKMVRDHAREHSRLELYDDLVLPALHLTEQERHRGWLEPQRQQFIRRSMQQVVEELATPKNPQSNGSSAAVICVAARDVADSLSALMLADLLRSRDIAAVGASRTQLLTGALPSGEQPPIVIISALPPWAAREALGLLDALRQVSPDCRVIVGLWRRRLNHARLRRAFRRRGALAVVHNFAHALDVTQRLLQPPRDEPDDAPRA